MPTEPDTETLQAVLRRGPPLRLAVLFGSGARGELRPDSDLDIGIVPEDPDLPLAAELDLQLELGAAAGRPIDVVRLDVLWLDGASTLLRGQVAREARLLLEGRPGAFLAFRVRATVEYLDFLPLYDEVAERFRQTLIRQAESPAVTDRCLVLKKLARLHEHVNLLRQRRPAALDEFRSRDQQDLAGLAFVVALQEAIDIAAHVCADDGLGLPGSYGESFLLLAAPGILGEELARQLARMVHVRNRIVHGYLSVDFETFWRDLPAGITGLDGFAAALARRAGPPPADKSAGS